MPPTDALNVEVSTTFTYDLQTFLDASGPFHVADTAGTAASRAGALKLVIERAPQVVLTDTPIRPAPDAPEGVRPDVDGGPSEQTPRGAHPGDVVLRLRRPAQGGVHGFVDVDRPPEDIVQALRIVADDGIALTPEQIALVAADRQRTVPALTPREREISKMTERSALPTSLRVLGGILARGRLPRAFKNERSLCCAHQAIRVVRRSKDSYPSLSPPCCSKQHGPHAGSHRIV